MSAVPSSATTDALYAALLADMGIAQFVSAAAGLLNTTVLLIGAEHRYIATSFHCKEDWRPEAVAAVKQELAGDGLSQEALHYAGAVHPRGSFLTAALPAQLGLAVLLCPVRIHGVIAAYTALLDTELEEDTIQYLPLLSGLIAQELQKTAPPRICRTPESDFLYALLHTAHPQQHLLEHQLARLGCTLQPYYCIAVVQPDGRSFTERDFDMVVQHLQGVLTGNLYAILEDQLVILFHQKEHKRLRRYVLRTLRQVAIDNILSIGISNFGSSLTEIRRFQRQAVQAILYGRTFKKDLALKPVFLFCEYAYGDLFDVCAAQVDLMDYVYPPLLDLLHYDQVNDADLMDTLFQYLLHNTNTNLTAKSMFIHKNTILYRLKLIRDILQIDLSAGENLFILNLSLRILTQLELFRPQEVADEYDMSSFDPSRDE